MNIIVRKIRGGFQAWITPGGAKFKRRGNTRAEAIAKLIFDFPAKFNVEKVLWDIKDERTRLYSIGRQYRKKPGPWKIKTPLLPVPLGPGSAGQIRLYTLREALPGKLCTTLESLFPERGNAVLADLCTLTSHQVLVKARGQWNNPLGAKGINLLQKLLSHYSLNFRSELDTGYNELKNPEPEVI